MKKQTPYRNLKQIIGRYWSAYGGINAFLFSPYVHLSIFETVLAVNLISDEDHWWDFSLQILPNILGFTLGGFAIFLSFGNEKFIAAISGNDPDEEEDYSPFMGICATFLHFIMIQSLALCFAIFGRVTRNIKLPSMDESHDTCACILHYGNMLFEWTGFWLFFYSIALIVAAALAIFRISTWYDSFHGSDGQEEQD